MNKEFNGALEAKQYSRRDWFSMTDKQRDTVRGLRANKKRKISAITADDNDQRETISVEDEDANEAPDAKDAGNQFGARGHKPEKG